jgi:hypothetical protein
LKTFEYGKTGTMETAGTFVARLPNILTLKEYRGNENVGYNFTE